MVTRKKLFLASSAELAEDRKEFEIFISRKNDAWVDQGVYLDLVLWEDFLDAVSKTRLQDEYNRAIRECDLFVMLFFTKVGQYTEEEFETAFGQFQSANRPFIFTYFKDAEISTGSASKKDLMSLWDFQEKLGALGHFYTVYKNIDELKFKFNQQLDKLAENGFIEFKPAEVETAGPRGNTYHGSVTGNGALAQGPKATAVASGAVYVGGNSTGDIVTGSQTKIDTGGDIIGRDKITGRISADDLERFLAPLRDAMAEHAPADRQAEAIRRVEDLKDEVSKGQQAEDNKIAKIVDGLVNLVPSAVGAVVSAFASPILAGIAGPATRLVLDKLKST